MMNWYYYHDGIDDWDIDYRSDNHEDYTRSWIGGFKTFTECKKHLMKGMLEDLRSVRSGIKDLRQLKKKTIMENCD